MREVTARRIIYAASGLAALVLAAGGMAAPDHLPSPEVRPAVSRSITLLQKSDREYRRQRGCFSCHHQGVPALALNLARRRGFEVDASGLRAQAEFTAAFLGGNRDAYRQGRGQGGQVDTAGYALLALQSGGWKPDETTGAVAEYLLLREPDADHWRAVSNRPPSEVSPFTATFLAVRALKAYGTPAQAERVAARVKKAREWLEQASARDTEDRVFRLWALTEAGGAEETTRSAAKELLAVQREDGGWAQTDDLKSDAYATGSALVALHETGHLGPGDAAYQKGVRFLLGAQLEDGSWQVVSRSKPFQPYFESGFPHGKDQFISAAATAWATAALALSTPVSGGS